MNPSSAQFIVARGHTRCFHGIRYQDQTFSPLGPISETKCRLVDVHTVRDDTYPQAVVGKQGAYGAGFPVSQRSHRVVQVGTLAQADYRSPDNLFIGGLGVTGTGDGAFLQEK